MGIYKPFDFSQKNEDSFQLDFAPDVEIKPLRETKPAFEFEEDIVFPKEPSSIPESFVTLYNAYFNANVSIKHEGEEADPNTFIEIVDQPLTDLDSNYLDEKVKAYINKKIATVLTLEGLYKEVFDTAMYLLQEEGIKLYIRGKVSDIYEELGVYLSPSLEVLLDKPYSALTTNTNKADLLEEFITTIEQFRRQMEEELKVYGLNRIKASAIRLRWFMNIQIVGRSGTIISMVLATLSMNMHDDLAVRITGVATMGSLFAGICLYDIVLQRGGRDKSDVRMLKEEMDDKIRDAKQGLRRPTFKPVASIDDFLSFLSEENVVDEFKPQLEQLLSYVKDTISVEMHKEEIGLPSLLQKELQSKLKEYGNFVTHMNEHIDQTLDRESFYLFNGSPRKPFIDRWREVANEIPKTSER